MSTLVQRFASVLFNQQSEIASLKQQLAVALADAAADDAAVAEAQAAATSAQERANQLQQLVDADVIEDQQLEELLAAYEQPAEGVDDASAEDGSAEESAS